MLRAEEQQQLEQSQQRGTAAQQQPAPGAWCAQLPNILQIVQFVSAALMKLLVKTNSRASLRWL
jgi:hypothetical protein